MKETGTAHWLAPNTGATNSSGFTALGGGYCYNNPLFGELKYIAYFFSSSEYNSSRVWTRYLQYDNIILTNYGFLKGNGFSARCIKD